MRILLLVFAFLLALVGLPPAKAEAPPARAEAPPARAQAPARPAPTRDWSTSVVFAPDGTIAVGNPAARVKLTEWLSYTCSHCADFAAASRNDLHALIRSGTVRVDYRTLPRDALDLAAALVVRCGGPGRFLAAHGAVFAGQKAMLDAGEAFAATPPAQKPTATIGERLSQLAAATPLRATARTLGIGDVALTRCLNDEAAQRRVIGVAEASQAANVEGTPTFDVNDRRVDAHGWAELKPLLIPAS